MSTAETLQLAGTIGVIIMSMLLMAAGYRREFVTVTRSCIVVAALFLVCGASVRLLIVPFAVLTQEQGRIVNGILGITFMGAIMQIMAFGYLEVKYQHQTNVHNIIEQVQEGMK